MTFNPRQFAEDTAHEVFEQVIRGSEEATAEPTHWQAAPNFQSRSKVAYAACGRMTSRFDNPPTCPICLKRKAEQDQDDRETAQALGITLG